jgi:phage shock protein PspC (stress-responsive transcriptional regulator)
MGIHHHPGMPGPYFWAFVIVRLALVALFIIVPWIIALAYVWRDARRWGQPGWLWALVAIFLGWFGILAYLIVRTFAPRASAPAAGRLPDAPPAPTIDTPPAE